MVMKKISLVILIIALLGITTITIYTLTHKKIVESEEIIKTKAVEKATSNMTESELSEIFNIQLNNKRHRLKSNYRLVGEEEGKSLLLTLYLDGFEIFSETVLEDLKINSIEEIFDDELEKFIVISEDTIQIISTDQDYLLVGIYFNIDGLKEYYYIWDVDRTNILDNILVYDETKEYASFPEEELTMFYTEDFVLATIIDNVVYVLEEQSTEDGLIFEEYTYTIYKKKVTKELINTYEILTNNV